MGWHGTVGPFPLLLFRIFGFKAANYETIESVLSVGLGHFQASKIISDKVTTSTASKNTSSRFFGRLLKTTKRVNTLAIMFAQRFTLYFNMREIMTDYLTVKTELLNQL